MKQDGIRVLFFHADWCQPCHVLEPALKELEHRGVRLWTIDVDEQGELAERYDVMGLPTVLVKRGRDELLRLGPSECKASTLVALVEGAIGE